jgi:rubrerythrin
MSLFSASDVLQFAVRMEENGELFYRQAADRTEKLEVKKLFNYPGEYLSYLHDYIDGKIFVAPADKSATSESSNVVKALDFAIQREMEAIHYYQEMKAFVPVENHETLDKIINEERKHFAQLSEAKKNIT